MRKGEKFEWVEISKKEYRKLSNAEKKVTSAKILKRIQAFKFMYLGWKYGRIAEFLNVTKDTITDWINTYRHEGIGGLLILNYKGGQPRLSEKQLLHLNKEASKMKFKVAKEAQHYIRAKFGVSYNLSHVQLLLKKGFVYPLKRLEKFQVIPQQ